MNDGPLVHVLRLGGPRAVGVVHDAYAERLYVYCWYRLYSRGAAWLALRDTLVRAEARACELRPGQRLTPWLYAIARAECARRLPEADRPDVPPARHDQDDAVPRVLAWRAVAGLPPPSRELLDLRYHHDLAPEDIATVVGRPARDVAKLMRRGRALLEEALVAEILAGGSPFECAWRTAAIRDRAAGAELRARLLRHSRECGTCGGRVPRRVSAAKVYDLLPRPAPPRSSRSRTVRALTDPALAHYRLLGTFAEPRRRRGSVTLRRAAVLLLATTVTGALWLAQAGDDPAAVRAPAPSPGVPVRQ